MSYRTQRITTYNNGTFQVETFYPPTPTGTSIYYMQKEDVDSGVFLNSDGKPTIRSCATTGGCPAVFVMLTPKLKVNLDKNWQFYLIAINMGMTLENISSILDTHWAFCNDSGFRSGALRNYILNKDLNAVDETGKPAYPRFDKDRTCSRSVVKGVELGSVLQVVTFDGNKPPPLKEGRSYPQRIEDINIDDYLYNPRDHRHMFFAANAVASKPGGLSSVAPVPRGAIYDWTEDGLPYTWLPHVSRHVVYRPLSQLTKVTTIPSPYRIVR